MVYLVWQKKLVWRRRRRGGGEGGEGWGEEDDDKVALSSTRVLRDYWRLKEVLLPTGVLWYVLKIEENEVNKLDDGRV